MRLDTLNKRMLYYRGLTDYKLIPNSYVLLMLDGRSFSKFCKQFKKPYDATFINMMNETAKYLCANIEGCKFAYVQSDEISLVLTDFDTSDTESWFGYRLTKILSIAASLATAKFNQLNTINKLYDDFNNSDYPAQWDVDEIEKSIQKLKLIEFDCKAWNVPSYNDVFAWILHRQIDCVRNSKQMAAQAFIPHKDLVKLHTDEQIALLKENTNIDWYDYLDGEKYGRFIWRQEVKHLSEEFGEYIRNEWVVTPAFPLFEEGGKDKFESINVIPKMV